jgi:peroxiredoxin
MARITNVVIIMAVLVSFLFVAGCSGDNAKDNVPTPGGPAPDFQLQDLDGQTVSLSSLLGKPVMVNFWATWCGPCRVEMPFIQEVFKDPEWVEAGLIILAVNAGQSPEVIQEFMEDNGLTFTVLLDTETEVAKLYNVSGIPTTYFIDKNGIIKDVKIGTFRNKAEIDWKLVNLMKEEES